MESQGLIQSFEYTHELAWNVMKGYIEYQGNSDIKGSRDAPRQAFAIGLIIDGENWMEMIKSRSQTTPSYKVEVADEITNKISTVYYRLFCIFKTMMLQIKNKQQS